ncbi:MAG: hypothetical protein WBJ13_01875 [Sedimentibacter sp.]
MFIVAAVEVTTGSGISAATVNGNDIKLDDVVIAKWKLIKNLPIIYRQIFLNYMLVSTYKHKYEVIKMIKKIGLLLFVMIILTFSITYAEEQVQNQIYNVSLDEAAELCKIINKQHISFRIYFLYCYYSF